MDDRIRRGEPSAPSPGPSTGGGGRAIGRAGRAIGRAGRIIGGGGRAIGASIGAAPVAFNGGAGVSTGDSARIDRARAWKRPLKPQSGRMSLAYKVQPGTHGCDTESVLRMWIKNELGVDPFVPTGPPLHTVSVTIDQQGPAIHAVIKVRAEDGELWYEDEMLERWCIRVMDRLVGIIGFTLLPALVPAPAPVPAPAARPEPDCNDACMRSLREEIQGLRPARTPWRRARRPYEPGTPPCKRRCGRSKTAL